MTHPIILPSGQGKAIYEMHFHNTNKCFGNDGVGNLQADSIAPFRVTTGSPGVFGAEIQIHDGTVIDSGSPIHSFDFGNFFVVDSSVANKTFLVQIWSGKDVFATSSLNSSFYYRTGNLLSGVQYIRFPTRVVTCDNKLWVRAKCDNVVASYLDFLVELHIYPWRNGF